MICLVPNSNGEPDHDEIREVNHCHGKGPGHPCTGGASPTNPFDWKQLPDGTWTTSNPKAGKPPQPRRDPPPPGFEWKQLPDGSWGIDRIPGQEPKLPYPPGTWLSLARGAGLRRMINQAMDPRRPPSWPDLDNLDRMMRTHRPAADAKAETPAPQGEEPVRRYRPRQRPAWRGRRR